MTSEDLNQTTQTPQITQERQDQLGWWFSQNLTPSPGGRMSADILFLGWRNWCDATKLNWGSKIELYTWLRQQGVKLISGNDGRLYCENYKHIFPRPTPSLFPA